MNSVYNKTTDIPTHVKDQDLVQRRRLQIVDAAVKLFIEKGFHKTTTRQIARAAGFSIGTLYEYITTKEDVLYLVCVAIHDEVERCVAEVLRRALDALEWQDAEVRAIREGIDDMNTGRVTPLREFDKEFRKRKNIPLDA